MSKTLPLDPTRRQLLLAGGATVAALALDRRAQAQKSKPAPPGKPAVAGGFEQMKLPYADSALAPGISGKVIEFHYGKHHKTYVDKTNELVKGTELQGKSLEDIIRATYGKADKTPLYNAASQVWNHDFYWQSMKPKGGGTPSGDLGKRLTADFGSVDAFAKEWSTAANGQFGSGWAWLIEDAGKLKVVKTSNADNPIALGKKPILTIDVWEHAYYLDYQNRRADYVKAFLDSLANWDFAAANLARKG
jgi:superoxide dismutase, Fe-Mn family